MTANAMMGNWEKKGGIFGGKKAKLYNTLAGEELIPEITNPDAVIKVPKLLG